MKPKTTLRLFVLVCVIGILTWYAENYLESTAERKDKKLHVLNVKAEEINNLTIKCNNLNVDCVKKGKKWFFVRPLEAPADGGEIDQILSVIEALRKEETVTGSQRRERELSLEDYGLRNPRARFVLSDEFGMKEILVGDKAPLGNFVYVKTAISDDVIATTSAITNIIPGSIEYLRDRMVLHGNVSRTSRLEIQGVDGGFIQLVRLDNDWQIQQPVAAKADTVKVNQILDALFSLEIKEFIWDAQTESVNTEPPINDQTALGAVFVPYGLAEDEAVARVAVWGNGNEVGKELLLGKQADANSDKVYARRKDFNSVYTVQKDIVEMLGRGVCHLRDRTLFGIKPEKVKYLCFEKDNHKLELKKKEKEGWVIAEPVQWQADRHVVSDVIEKLIQLKIESFNDGSQTNITELGLNPPAFVVQLLEKYPEPKTDNPQKAAGVSEDTEKTAPEKQNRLHVGVLSEKSANVFVRFEDQPIMFGDKASIFAISADAIANLGDNPADPLVYRNRTMLALDPTSIKRITLLKEGKEQSILMEESGEWTPAGTETNKLDMNVVQDIVFAASNLRALRIECHNPENVAQYGLDPYQLMLTLGLTGEQGIRKSLIMGFRSKTDGIYAMIQGQDVVFVLESGLVQKLTRNLVNPIASPKNQRSGNDTGK
ncbi:DUF4340 domain-containing protein [Verrucomicrobiota bacterium]